MKIHHEGHEGHEGKEKAKRRFTTKTRSDLALVHCQGGFPADKG